MVLKYVVKYICDVIVIVVIVDGDFFGYGDLYVFNVVLILDWFKYVVGKL